MSPSPSRQGFVDVRGARLFWRSEGRGRVLLLLHGWALDGRMWAPQVAALSRQYQVVTVDRRGFGRSSGQASIDREAGDIVALCTVLGLRPYAVVGMSQGTRVALRLAQRRTRSLRRLVLDGPPAPQRRNEATGEDPPLGRYRALLESQGPGAFRRAWSAHPLMQLQCARASSRWLLGRMLKAYRARDLLAPARPASGSKPARPEAIRVRTLVIAGARDQPTRIAAARALAGRMPRALMGEIPGAGHLANLDAPREWLRRVEAFLRR